MKRVRLREAHSAGQLAELYATPHDHVRWSDHRIRAAMTIALTVEMDPGVVADLSCGNGWIARHLADDPILGDLAPGHPITGPLEQTLPDLGVVDTYVCSETLEHLDDPGLVLTLIRSRARHLVLTTPIDNWGDTNVEHYWAWDREGVEDLAGRASWSVERFAALDCRRMGGYLTGMWVLS